MSNTTELLTPEQVNALYERHSEELMRFLRGVLRDAALASDCLQATFAKLLERGHDSRPETRRAWLFKVAYQEAMLARRREATTDRVLHKAAWSVSREVEQPEGRLATSEAKRVVMEALERLPADQRAVVRMRMFEEKTFATIAAELGIPLGTALGRMRTALMKLKVALENYE